MFDNKLNLNNKIFVGVVEDVNDSKRKGRIKVRVQTLFDDLPIEHIPWAEPQRSLDGKSFCVPAIGKLVNIVFNNGNIYDPKYIYSENYNTNLQQKLNDLSDDEYKNFYAILLDHRTQIYSDDTNLVMDYKFNKMTISNDDINIILKDNDQTLNLGGYDASESAMLGDHFLEWFDDFMSALLKPSSLIGNFSAPILKPEVDMQISKYQALRSTFLSKHVKIVDNGSCYNESENRKNAPAQDDDVAINDKKILESEDNNELKKKIEKNREEDNKQVENSKPSEEDKLPEGAASGEVKDGVMYGDSHEIVKEIPKINIDTIELSDQEKYIIDKNQKIDERKNTPKKELIIDYPEGNPYSDIWYGSKSSSTDFSAVKINKTYGDFTTDSSNNPINAANYSDKDRKFQKKKTLKDGTIIKNGEIDQKYLAAVDTLTIKNKKATIFLESNAAIAFSKLNDEVIEKFGKPLDITGNASHYRTFNTQYTFFKKYKPGYAAKPGTSGHGWGLCCDITNFGGKIKFDSDIFKFLEKEGKKYHIVNPQWAKSNKKPIEPWHWAYVGPAWK